MEDVDDTLLGKSAVPIDIIHGPCKLYFISYNYSKCMIYLCSFMIFIVHVGEDDLQEVKEAVIKLAAKSRSLGLALGIRASVLDAIRSKVNDPDERLTEVLEMWLKQMHDQKKHGCPSWRTLVKAVDNSAGGNDHALAKNIASRHPGMCISGENLFPSPVS